MKIRTVSCFLLYCVLLLMQMTCVSPLLWRIPQSSNPLMGLTHSLQRMGQMMAKYGYTYSFRIVIYYFLCRMVRGNFHFPPSYPPRRPPPYYYQVPHQYPHVQTQYQGPSNEIYTNHIEDQYIQEDSFTPINNGGSYFEEVS